MKGKSCDRVVQTDREYGMVRCYQLDSPAATEGTKTRSYWLSFYTTLSRQQSNLVTGDKKVWFRFNFIIEL